MNDMQVLSSVDDMQVITAARANGWCTHPMFDAAGNEVAFVAQKGPEIHFQVRADYRYRAMQRNRVRAFAVERMADWGYLTTRVPHGDTVNARFVERCGFKKTWSNQAFDFYMLTALPFERS